MTCAYSVRSRASRSARSGCSRRARHQLVQAGELVHRVDLAPLSRGAPEHRLQSSSSATSCPETAAAAQRTGNPAHLGRGHTRRAQRPAAARPASAPSTRAAQHRHQASRNPVNSGSVLMFLVEALPLLGGHFPVVRSGGRYASTARPAAAGEPRRSM